jgi:hypothetical protein
MSLKLSEIKEQIEQAVKQGVSFPILAAAMEYGTDWNEELSPLNQCILVFDLERFAESRHWYTSHYVNYYPIGHERRYTTEFTNHTYEGNCEKTSYAATGISWYGATPLQATLNAFLQIDWSVKE